MCGHVGSLPRPGGLRLRQAAAPFAPIRPAFASPGTDVGIFVPRLDVGKRYTVTFGSDPGVTIEAAAQFRRDLAEAASPGDALAAALATPGPCLVNVPIAEAANVYPMVPPGGANRDMIDGGRHAAR